MYEKIYNPKTNRYVNISSKLGLSIIENYLQQIGGSVPQVNLAKQLSSIVKTQILSKDNLLKKYKWKVDKGVKMDYKDERIKDITNDLMNKEPFKPILELFDEMANKLLTTITTRNQNTLPSKKNKADIIQQSIELFIRRLIFDKGNLDYLFNPLFTDLQYQSVAGFNPTEPIKLLDKYSWNNKLHSVIRHIYNPAIYLCCEDYIDGSSGDTPEFTYYKRTEQPIGSWCDKSDELKLLTQKTDPKGRNEGANLTLDDIYIENMHNTSGEKTEEATKKVLEKFIELNSVNQNGVIFGGDTNIYYGLTGEDNIVESLSVFKNTIDLAIRDKLIDRHTVVLISNKIIHKKRPFNFFSNAQSATKTESKKLDTMMIFISGNLKNKITYNKNLFTNITDIGSVEAWSSKKWKNANNVISAFKGADESQKISTIDEASSNPLSDHHNIYVDLLDKSNNTQRILFSNNLGILSKRGYTDNSKLWKISTNDIEQLHTDLLKDISDYGKKIVILLQTKPIQDTIIKLITDQDYLNSKNNK